MKLVIGPSHVVRWVIEHSFRPSDNALHDIKVIASGGLPLWSDYVSKELSLISKDIQIYVLVGDFRFGNEACDNPDNLCPPSMYGINKAAINSAILIPEMNIILNLVLQVRYEKVQSKTVKESN